MKLTLLLLIIATAEKIFARPQLDLPPLVDPPPLQIFVPDLQLIGDGPELQPQPTQPPPAPSSPPPPPQPSTQAPSAPIVNDYNLKFNGAGDIIGYSYQVETPDGFQKQENGEIRQIAATGEGVAVVGRYSYTGLDGKRYNWAYTADENGFRPKLEN